MNTLESSTLDSDTATAAAAAPAGATAVAEPVPAAAPATPPVAPLIYLSKYNPLAMYPLGLEAIRNYRIPPFVDASCRREPDFEHSMPSITTISHGAQFAPRLVPGDLVVYITAKGKYENWPTDHWRFTGVLKVVERFTSHEDAAAWYREKGLPLPSNCMVEGNPPLALERTCGVYLDDNDKEKVPQNVGEWDARYQRLADANPIFLACRPLYIRLKSAPTINENDIKEIFPNKRMPVARTPSTITPETLKKLLQTTGIKIVSEEFEL